MARAPIIDNRVRTRVNWGPYKGRKMFKVPDHGLEVLIEKSHSAYMRQAAFDEYRDRAKLGLLGDNP